MSGRVLAAEIELETAVLAFIAGDRTASFEELALRVFRFQREHNAPYAAFCGGAPVRHWRDIPAVPQSAFKHAALRCFPAEETAKTFRTSGTTGEGFGEHHFPSTRLYDAAALAGWDALGLPLWRHCVLAAPSGAAPLSSLSHMFGTLGARGSQKYYAPDAFDAAELAADLEESREPVALLGTALAFLAFFDRLGVRKLNLPDGSFAMETGGYKGSGRDITKAALYTRFNDSLGLPAESIINEYGMTELSSQFYTRGLGAPHAGPPWARALVIDPETGQEAAPGSVGVLKIFDLANLGSVLAIQTRDLALARGEGFELLGRDPAALPRGCSRAADELLR